MDTVVLSSLLNGALLLVCLGLLLSFCVSCGQSGRQTPIHQQAGFTVIRGKALCPTVDSNRYNHVPSPGVSNTAISFRTPAPSSLRSPQQEPDCRPSYTPTEDDDGSYVNQDDGYIKVLPGEMPSMPKIESQPSLSSATVVTNTYNHVPSPGVSNTAISLSPWQEPERRPSYTPTEDDDDSYVNQDNDDDNDADGDKQGYINVLMDKASSMPENSSQPSLSSATVDSNRYNHVPSPGVSNTAISLTPAPSSLRSPCQEPERRTSYTPTEDDDDNNYVNMLDHEKGGLTPGMSQESMESDGNGSTEYVNTSPK